MAFTPVPPRSLDAAIAHLDAGGTIRIPSMTRIVVITKRDVARFRSAGIELLREDGDGYRMASGRRSVYILPGQMVWDA